MCYEERDYYIGLLFPDRFALSPILMVIAVYGYVTTDGRQDPDLQSES